MSPGIKRMLTNGSGGIKRIQKGLAKTGSRCYNFYDEFLSIEEKVLDKLFTQK